jgi:hypothetical protein
MTSLKTNLKLFIICASILTSCLTAKKVDKQVAKLYGEKQQPQKKKQIDFISITSSLTSTDNQTSTTETKTSNVLPLLFYWSWDYKNTCTLNPQIPINNFTTTVLGIANKRLKEKLNGQKLELSVDKIPNKFAFDDKAHLIFIIYAFGWDNVSIKAETADLVVSYKVLNNNAESKTGIITIPYYDDKKNLGMFTSWKKATSDYLDQYDANIISMSKLFVEKLMKEI